ncbi:MULTISPECIES: hypothetical protein [unclassified Ekhidna]|jgi:hypothetical protein|uniref:hypothetical protein n=1 Tax=unclassified Ekhidna TaxID=2632188 RepID=UPI0032E0022F
MNTGKAFIVTTLMLASLAVVAQNGSASYHQVTIVASAITIHGQTNINKFSCSMDQPALNDSIVVKNIWLNKTLEFEGLRLKYRVDQFECGISAMNSDFQELLKAEEEPYLYLELNSITLHPHNDAFEELDVDAEVEVLLAGVRKKIKIEGGKVINHSSAHMTLKGDKDLLMTDFYIEPPTKMFGMIKVTNDISIAFEIGMRVSSI